MAAELRTLLEAARAAVLANHSAASLCSAAGYKQPAKMLRSAEAMARAAVASLSSANPKQTTSSRTAKAAGQAAAPTVSAIAASSDVPAAGKKMRHKKKFQQKGKDVNLEARMDDDAPVNGVCNPGDGPSAAAPTARPEAARRERSPRGSPSPTALTSASLGVAPVYGPCRYAVGQAVMITELTGKPELNGRLGSVLSFDAVSDRFAIKLDSGGCVKVRVDNLQPSIFK